MASQSTLYRAKGVEDAVIPRPVTPSRCAVSSKAARGLPCRSKGCSRAVKQHSCSGRPHYLRLLHLPRRRKRHTSQALVQHSHLILSSTYRCYMRVRYALISRGWGPGGGVGEGVGEGGPLQSLRSIATMEPSYTYNGLPAVGSIAFSPETGPPLGWCGVGRSLEAQARAAVTRCWCPPLAPVSKTPRRPPSGQCRQAGVPAIPPRASDRGSLASTISSANGRSGAVHAKDE
jgi:hypothetical protein